jgi:hypothetical protein
MARQIRHYNGPQVNKWLPRLSELEPANANWVADARTSALRLCKVLFIIARVLSLCQ